MNGARAASRAAHRVPRKWSQKKNTKEDNSVGYTLCKYDVVGPGSTVQMNGALVASRSAHRVPRKWSRK